MPMIGKGYRVAPRACLMRFLSSADMDIAYHCRLAYTL